MSSLLTTATRGLRAAGGGRKGRRWGTLPSFGFKELLTPADVVPTGSSGSVPVARTLELVELDVDRGPQEFPVFVSDV